MAWDKSRSRLEVRLDNMLLMKLKKYCEKNRYSQTEIIHLALKKFLEGEAVEEEKNLDTKLLLEKIAEVKNELYYVDKNSQILIEMSNTLAHENGLEERIASRSGLFTDAVLYVNKRECAKILDSLQRC
jgi:metal-responsive CopG/Arc/MetJ family transcriptional regulator